MNMKSLVAIAFVALALLSAVASAQAASPHYVDYPEWAQKALEPQG
jgi:hypothetical protein